MDCRDRWQAHVEALTQPMAHVTHQTPAREAQTRMVARRLLTRLTHALCALLAIGLVIGWLTPAAGHTISCGDTLGPGGRLLLEADLDCGTVSPALTVRDGAQLDLGGHTLSGGGGSFLDGTVILLDGQGAVVHNGIVEGSGSRAVGIRVAGEGGHTVRRVSVVSSGTGGSGVIVASDHNRLINNVVSGFFVGAAVGISGNQNRLTSTWATGGQIGFFITGDDNRLVENTISVAGVQGGIIEGFIVSGNQNVLLRNTADGTLFVGFGIDGDGNRLVRNLALDAGVVAGIEVSGHETVIVGNTALDNFGRDLVDENEDCDNNRWAQNVFRTSRAGATENPACIRGQPPQARDMVRLP